MRFAAIAMVVALDTSPSRAGVQAERVFDAVSIKENRSGSLDGVVRWQNGRFRVDNPSLRALIRIAYGARDHQLIAVPGWASQPYDVNAVYADGASASGSTRVEARGNPLAAGCGGRRHSVTADPGLIHGWTLTFCGNVIPMCPLCPP